MANTLQSANDPSDSCLESVLPRVHQWHAVTNDSIRAQSAAIQGIEDRVQATMQVLIDKVDNLAEQIVSTVADKLDNNRELAEAFAMLSERFLNNSRSSQQGRREQFKPIAAAVAPTEKSPYVARTENGVMPMTDIEFESTSYTPPLTTVTGTAKDHQSYRMATRHLSLEDMVLVATVTTLEESKVGTSSSVPSGGNT